MKKLNNKGFFLVETVIVATFIVSVLIFLFVQTRNINKNYQRSFSYNTVNSLYNINNVKIYLKNSAIGGLDGLKTYTNASTSYYLDLTSCPSTYLTEINYCKAIFSEMKITKLIMTKENMKNLFNITLTNKPDTFDQNFYNFLKYIGSVENSSKYLLIASFEDGTYAYLSFA